MAFALLYPWLTIYCPLHALTCLTLPINQCEKQGTELCLS